jgi:hypothetical protein
VLDGDRGAGGLWLGGAGGKRGSAGRCKAAGDEPGGETERLPAQGLVEHELGHGGWGISPVEDGRSRGEFGANAPW